MDNIDSEPLRSLYFVLLDVQASGLSAGVAAGIIAMILFLVGSALTSAAEVGFFSLGTGQFHELKGSDHKADKKVVKLLENPRRLLATLLVTNTFFNVAIVIISVYITSSLFDITVMPYWLAFMLQIVIVTALILIFGEIIPKTLATRNIPGTAREMAGFMHFFIRFFYPVSSLLLGSTHFIDTRLNRKNHLASLSELSDAIENTSSHDNIEEEKKMLQGIVKFGDIEVGEIMKSRMDVTAVNAGIGFGDLLKIVLDSGYSRIPVYEDSFDNITGILYIKDLLPHIKNKPDFNWKAILREAFFVPENKKISDLLQEFQAKNIHMAVVVDEYGATSGIVTLEDIIEEIIGEINDEHDEPLSQNVFSRIDDRSFIFEGKISLNDLCKILDIEDDIFDEVRGEADSLAGLMLELMEKMPEKNESVTYRDFRFTVKSADKRRIKKVLVTIINAEDDTEE